MRPILRKVSSIAAVFLFSAAELCADDVQIRTGFPSPYGTYGQADSSSTTNLATRGGNVQLASGVSARVAVGTANPEAGAQRTLGVRLPFPNVAFFQASNGFGVGVSPAGNDVQAQSGPVATLALNPFGGNVGVGVTNPLYTLHVSGTIGLDDGATSGEIKTVYDAAGEYGHAYAP